MSQKHLLLDKSIAYPTQYAPHLLCPIPRALGRQLLKIPATLPFFGADYWTAYEISWLNLRGKPEVALAMFTIPCDAPFLIESKSLKLYLNSLNQEQFATPEIMKSIIRQDLSSALLAPVQMQLLPVDEAIQLPKIQGFCLDVLDVSIEHYDYHPSYLAKSSENEEDSVYYSHLLKSNCPVTGQPDWATVVIAYQGRKLSREGLLKYLVSLRNCQEFHEQCVERIFMDITQILQPDDLTVYARYTRRGGLDINPFRSKYPKTYQNQRLLRQ